MAETGRSGGTAAPPAVSGVEGAVGGANLRCVILATASSSGQNKHVRFLSKASAPKES